MRLLPAAGSEGQAGDVGAQNGERRAQEDYRPAQARARRDKREDGRRREGQGEGTSGSRRVRGGLRPGAVEAASSLSSGTSTSRRRLRFWILAASDAVRRFPSSRPFSPLNDFRFLHRLFFRPLSSQRQPPRRSRFASARPMRILCVFRRLLLHRRRLPHRQLQRRSYLDAFADGQDRGARRRLLQRADVRTRRPASTSQVRQCCTYRLGDSVRSPRLH